MKRQNLGRGGAVREKPLTEKEKRCIIPLGCNCLMYVVSSFSGIRMRLKTHAQADPHFIFKEESE
jgi:hypothetical protein